MPRLDVPENGCTGKERLRPLFFIAEHKVLLVRPC